MVLLTASTMVLEIFAGMVFGSMALFFVVLVLRGAVSFNSDQIVLIDNGNDFQSTITLKGGSASLVEPRFLIATLPNRPLQLLWPASAAGCRFR